MSLIAEARSAAHIIAKSRPFIVYGTACKFISELIDQSNHIFVSETMSFLYAIQGRKKTQRNMFLKRFMQVFDSSILRVNQSITMKLVLAKVGQQLPLNWTCIVVIFFCKQNSHRFLVKIHQGSLTIILHRCKSRFNNRF
jgi:hypothetical protein